MPSTCAQYILWLSGVGGLLLLYYLNLSLCACATGVWDARERASESRAAQKSGPRSIPAGGKPLFVVKNERSALAEALNKI